MTTFHHLPAEDRDLLINKFDQLGLDPPPNEAAKTDGHNCASSKILLGRITVNGRVKKDICGCSKCGTLAADCGRMEPSALFSSHILSCIITGAETIKFLPTDAGKKLKMPFRNLEISAILEDLKTDHERVALSQLEQA